MIFHIRFINVRIWNLLHAEMSPEQQKQLIEIRKRKQELLLEIQVSNNHFK